MDRAGKDYWQASWTREALPPRIDPESPNLSACVERSIAARFDDIVRDVPRGASFLEVGSGHSAWLPFAATRWGFRVTGIDYTTLGVETSLAMLAREKVVGDVVLADMFHPPDALRSSFDVVFSNGVIEHFEDTSHAVSALRDLVRPGGLVITMIPNVTGSVGLATKVLSRKVYDAHVPLTREDLRAGHERAGLEIVSCEYLLSTNFGVVDLGERARFPGELFRRAALRLLVDTSRLVWLIESKTRPAPATKAFSPLVLCVARRPREPTVAERP